MTTSFSRRQTLGGLALASTGLGLMGQGSGAAAQGGLPEAGVCRLFPQAVEGPYYFDPTLVRSAIADGRAGVPLSLTLHVIEMGPCTPIVGARVDIWHADALGIYSGYAHQGADRQVTTVGETFLRGTQVTDDRGAVTFNTIYPGWYPGRTPHIHAKVFLDKTSLLTGQLYFEDALSARIYAQHAPYATRPKADTTNLEDGIFRSGEREGGGMVATIVEDSGALRASLVIAVERSGTAASSASGWRGAIRRTLGL